MDKINKSYKKDEKESICAAVIKDSQMHIHNFNKNNFSRQTSKSLYVYRNGHGSFDFEIYPHDSSGSDGLTIRKSSTSSVRSRSRIAQNSILGLTCKSFTNSDSALPLSYGSNTNILQTSFLPLLNASKCSSSSNSDPNIASPLPAVPVRTTSSPQKKKSRRLFFGREWVFNRIDKWLKHSSVEGNTTCSLMIIGGPGTGKTAILENLVNGEHKSISDQVIAYHACSSQFAASMNLPRFILSIRDQISERDDAIGDFYREQLSKSKTCRLFTSARLCAFPDEVLTEGIFKILADINAELFSNRKLFILVDAADECLRLKHTTEIRTPSSLISFLKCSHKCFSHASSASDRTDTINKLSSGLNGLGVKEGQGWVSRNLLELLAVNALFLPPWIGIIITCRRETYSIVRRLFPCSTKIFLDDMQCPFVTKDLNDYVLHRLNTELSLQSSFASSSLGQEIIQMLQIKSNASILYLQIVLNAVAECWLAPEYIKTIPGTLSGLFLWLCQRLLSPIRGESSTQLLMAVKPVLNLILATPRPITISEIDIILLVNTVQSRVLESWKKSLSLPYFLVNTLPSFLALQPPQWVRLLDYSQLQSEKIVEFIHSSFRDWLLDIKYATPVYLGSTREGHTMLAIAALNQIRQKSNISHSFTWDILYNFTRSALYNSAEALHKLTNSLRNVELDFSTDAISNLDCWMFIHDPILVHCSFAGSSISQLIEDALNYECRLFQPLEDNRTEDLFQQTSKSMLLMVGSEQISSIGQLCTAAFQGKLELVRNILDQVSVDIEARDAAGSTPLVLASRQGHVEIVRSLLASNARLDKIDQDGWSAIRSAAWGGHIDVVNLLLEAGVDVDITGPDCRTALRAAAWAGHIEIVQRLLAGGANVNRADAEGRTPLIAAAYMGCSDIIEILAEAGADLNHADQDGRTALCVAAFCVTVSIAHTEVVEMLLQLGADPNLGDRENVTPLIGAAQSGQRTICELCLEADADVDKVDKSCRSALVAAVINGHVEVVKLLLFWCAAVHTIDANGRSVLSIAAACGHADVVRELLARGLDEAHRDHMGATPLHLAAAAGHYIVVKLLLEAGSRCDEIDNAGQTPLLVACQANYVRVIRLLLKPALAADDDQSRISLDQSINDLAQDELGCELQPDHDDLASTCTGHDYLFKTTLETINRAALNGRSPLRAAALNNNASLVRVLLAIGADPDQQDSCGRTTLGVVVLEGMLQMTKLLLHTPAPFTLSRLPAGSPCKCANPLLADDEGRCPLHIAAWQGQVELIHLLLQSGTPVDVRDKENRTPLHSTAWQNHSNACRVLLEQGAMVNAVCSQGATALCIASQEGHVTVCEVLLAHGANALQVDIYGRSPYKVAQKAGHVAVCALLERYGGRSTSPRLVRQRRKTAPPVPPPPSYPEKEINRHRFSFEPSSGHLQPLPSHAQTPIVDSSTFLWNKLNQSEAIPSFSNTQHIAKYQNWSLRKQECGEVNEKEVSSAYARPSISFINDGNDKVPILHSEWTPNFTELQNEQQAPLNPQPQDSQFQGWPLFSAQPVPAWCQFPIAQGQVFPQQPVATPSYQQMFVHPSQIYSTNWAHPHQTSQFVFTGNLPSQQHLQPTTTGAYILTPQSFLVQPQPPQHPQHMTPSFQPSYFVQPTAFGPPIPPPTMNNAVDLHPHHIKDGTSPPVCVPSSSANAQIAPAHQSDSTTNDVNRSTHYNHHQKHQSKQRHHSRPPSSYYPAPDVVMSSRLPSQSDPINTFGSSIMLQTPPHSLEPGNVDLVSPIVSESMTYYSMTSPIGEDDNSNDDDDVLKTDGRPTIQLIVNTKLGEDVINLNEVTDSEYESSAVWVSRRCDQVSDEMKHQKKNSFSKRILGSRISADFVSGTFQETKKIKSSSSKSKLETGKLIPKFSSPGHGGPTPAAGSKMKNAIQEVWKEARRKAFDRGSLSGAHPTQPQHSASTNNADEDVFIASPDIESHI